MQKPLQSASELINHLNDVHIEFVRVTNYVGNQEGVCWLVVK